MGLSEKQTPPEPIRFAVCTSTHEQVRICWQCCNYWHDMLLASDNKPIVFLNCDESNVIMDAHHRSGVLVRRRDVRGVFFSDEQHTSRGSFTILAWISSNPEIQKELDQFFIVSKKLMNQRTFASLQPLLQERTHLWRLESAWLNSHVFIACLKELNKSLRRWRERYNFVIVLDCASIHMSDDVLRAARILRLPLVFFPRNSTWLLQPLDTHVFRTLKSKIRSLQRREALSRRCFRMNLNETVRHSILAVQEVVNQRDWSRAFNHNGVTEHQRLVGSRLRKTLQYSEPFDIGSSRPSVADVLSILPRNKQNTRVNLLLDALAPRPAPRPLPAAGMAEPGQSPTSRSNGTSPRSRHIPESDSIPQVPNIVPHVSPPGIQESAPPATLDNSWTHRLRPRNVDNAAICGSDIKRERSQTPPSGRASSSWETWQTKRD